jgi:hypothetical protein
MRSILPSLIYRQIPRSLISAMEESVRDVETETVQTAKPSLISMMERSVQEVEELKVEFHPMQSLHTLQAKSKSSRKQPQEAAPVAPKQAPSDQVRQVARPALTLHRMPLLGISRLLWTTRRTKPQVLSLLQTRISLVLPMPLGSSTGPTARKSKSTMSRVDQPSKTKQSLSEICCRQRSSSQLPHRLKTTTSSISRFLSRRPFSSLRSSQPPPPPPWEV